MTTIDYKIAHFNKNIVKMDPTNYKRERRKATNAIAKTIANALVLPLVIGKNIKKLVLATLGKSKAKALVKVVNIALDSDSSEEVKMEIYADFQFLQEILNSEKKRDGGYLTQAINKQREEIADIINHYEPIFYKKAYPNNPDRTSPEYIDHVKSSHLIQNSI